ncbi:hypothetical protein OGAPHI_002473 [Ogataea philodendri]|uniref:Serine/threonine-protein phosphatase 4 regulatory subunit 3-like central domain-containing protein n=1 Tax=Ogataea philodendri TaxID=1378263 RepID=A0A9P8T7R1_9ASCO|nr:uncharacterized protein OGAPHI_002473 [Ogataea philodendri]KAH3668719.1 hypothetical protein OGAPHI_002473 [Ogataea philodendri]
MDVVRPTSPRRVKVYTLEDDKWMDRGTGYCSGMLEGGPHFLVRNENDTSETLLKATIEGTTQYQRQQDTLIVWTDSEGNDYALSFQEPDGCLSLCEFLINIQHSVEPNISLVAVISNGQDGEVTEVIAGPIPEPCFPTDSNLGDLLELLNQGAKSNKFKEKLLEFIENEGFLTQLIETFHRNEENRHLVNLYYLCDIVKTLVFYNDSAILDTLVNDDTIDGVAGILEYDSEFPSYKTNNREYLAEKTSFKEVVPLHNENIKSLVKRTFRLQFLKDVVLARLLDDASFNCISTMIHLNEDQILKFIRTDPEFLPSLFGLYDKHDDAKSRDGIKLINQFTLIAKKFQPTPRSDFYRSLIENGLVKMIQFAFKDSHTESRILATELIVTIIEHDVLLFNKKNSEMDTTLMSILVDVLLEEPNYGLKTQAFEAIKALLDPANLAQSSMPIDSSPSNGDTNIEGSMLESKYLQSFYQNAAENLFGPLERVITDPACKNTTVTYSNLCELLNFVAREHDRNTSKEFILNHRYLQGIGEIQSKRYSLQLRLSALRCLKSIIMLDDEDYTQHLIRNDILRGTMEMLREVNNQNNLANSACLSVLHLILQNRELLNFKALQKYLVANYSHILRLNYIGRELVTAEDQFVEEQDALQGETTEVSATSPDIPDTAEQENPPVKTKNSRPSEDETVSPAKERKLNSFIMKAGKVFQISNYSEEEEVGET